MNNDSSLNPNSTLDLLSKLPIDITFDILLRLPLKSLSNCRYVSKSWSNFILNPRFTHHHFTKHNLPLAIFPTRFGPSYLIDPENLSRYERSAKAYDLGLKEFKENFSIGDGYWARFDVIGTANGLVCFAPECHDYEPAPYYVVNPITRDYMLVPESPLIDVQPVGSGFGFDEVRKEYKLVRILPHPIRTKREWEWECEDVDDDAVKEERVRTVDNVVTYGNKYEIFTLGSRSWRQIYFSKLTIMSIKKFSVVVNGCIHWVSGKKTVKEYCCTIISFNMAREKLDMMQMPPLPRPSKNQDVLEAFDLLVLNGCLCVIDDDPSGGKGLWAMKKYGVHSSWVKEYSFKPNVFYRRWHGVHEVMELKNGELLLVDKEGNLSYYDRKKKTSKSIMLHDRDGNQVQVQPDFAVILKGSLISPKAIGSDQRGNII
ncbi:hypothetical protein ACHQM5_003010 [Ranunculus cassubicifolius]